MQCWSNKTLLALMCAAGLVACSDGTHEHSDAGPPAADAGAPDGQLADAFPLDGPSFARQSPTRLEVASFVTHGLAELSSSLPGYELSEPEVWFQDGAANIDGPTKGEPAMDLARAVLLVRASGTEHLGAAQFAYVAGLNGGAFLSIVTRFTDEQGAHLAYATSESGMVTLREGTTESEAATLIADLGVSFPDATFEYIAVIQTVIFEVPAASYLDLVAAFHTSPLFEAFFLDVEVYADPFGFNPATQLPADGDVELADLLQVSKRAEDWFCANEPALPPPFGPGQVLQSLTGRYLVHLRAETAAACRAAISQLYPEVTLSTPDPGPAGALVENGTGVIASIAMLPCVDRVEPQ